MACRPLPDLQQGLGEMEIKVRYVLCAGNDLLADSSFGVEQWALRKVSDAFHHTISDADGHWQPTTTMRLLDRLGLR